MVSWRVFVFVSSLPTQKGPDGCLLAMLTGPLAGRGQGFLRRRQGGLQTGGHVERLRVDFVESLLAGEDGVLPFLLLVVPPLKLGHHFAGEQLQAVA